MLTKCCEQRNSRCSWTQCFSSNSATNWPSPPDDSWSWTADSDTRQHGAVMKLSVVRHWESTNSCTHCSIDNTQTNEWKNEWTGCQHRGQNWSCYEDKQIQLALSDAQRFNPTCLATDTFPISESAPWPFRTCLILFLVFQPLGIEYLGRKKFVNHRHRIWADCYQYYY